MITLAQIIAKADPDRKIWISLNEEKILPGLRNLNELHWPLVVHSTEFKCSRISTPTVAGVLGYEKKQCSFTADGKWSHGKNRAATLYIKCNAQSSS